MPQGNSAFTDETIIPIEGTPSGFVFENQQALLWKNLRLDQFSHASIARYLQAGVKSGCWLPLCGREGAVGVLFIGSRDASAFDSIDLELLLQIARQIGVQSTMCGHLAKSQI